MAWRFLDFRLDPQLAELRGPDGPLSVEPRVLDLLILLADNPDRVITKDEIIEKVWGGRIVSDSAVSTSVKEARRALGDSGQRQTIIKTVHGRGFRFVAPLERIAGAVVASSAPPPEPQATGAGRDQPRVAVLPFQALGPRAETEALCLAIPAELITGLARLRWLFVTARGSSFRFRDTDTDARSIADVLGVRYLIGGLIEDGPNKLTVSVELQVAATGEILWTDRFTAAHSEIDALRDQIIADVVSALEVSITSAEALEARMRGPDAFTAWSHFHIGLEHAFRFNHSDGAEARRHFEQAITLDPGFARAHAGLSFAHFQTAFLEFGNDRADATRKAKNAAQRAIELDPRDPFAVYNMGRAQWLDDGLEASLEWIDLAIRLNPNFAQAHYARAWTNALSNRGESALISADRAIELSPIDPMHYAMIGSRGIAAIAQGDFKDGQRWLTRAANAPSAHFYMDALAAAGSELAGDADGVARWSKRLKTRRPDFSSQQFFRSFPFAKGETRSAFEGSFARLGL